MLTTAGFEIPNNGLNYHPYYENNEHFVPKITVERQIDTNVFFSEIFDYKISSSNEQNYINIANNFEYTKELEGKIYSYLALEDGWDGYDGVPPKKRVIETGKKIIDMLKSYLSSNNLPQTMLTGDGELGFYWEKDEEYLEISIKDADKYTFFIEKENRIMSFEEDIKLTNNLPTNLLFFIHSL